MTEVDKVIKVTQPAVPVPLNQGYAAATLLKPDCLSAVIINLWDLNSSVRAGINNRRNNKGIPVEEILPADKKMIGQLVQVKTLRNLTGK